LVDVARVHDPRAGVGCTSTGVQQDRADVDEHEVPADVAAILVELARAELAHGLAREELGLEPLVPGHGAEHRGGDRGHALGHGQGGGGSRRHGVSAQLHGEVQTGLCRAYIALCGQFLLSPKHKNQTRSNPKYIRNCP